jgi:hypothetical protein
VYHEAVNSEQKDFKKSEIDAIDGLITGEQMSENEMPWNCIMKKAMLRIHAPLIYGTQRNIL